METLAERLKLALVKRGHKVKPLAKTIRDRGIPRSSYSMVRRYLESDGDYQPQQDWLVEAAKILRVRMAWLVAGEGPMELGEFSVPTRPIWEVAGCGESDKGAFMARFSHDFPDYGEMTETLQLVFRNMFARWLGSMDLDQLTIEERADKAVQLGRLLVAPLRLFQPGKKLHTRRNTDFMLSQLSALGMAMPDWPE